jgi:hypothetical protein
MFTAALLTLAAISAPPADYVLIERVDYVLIPIERSVVVKRTTRPAAPPVVVTRSAAPVTVGPVYVAPAPRIIRYVAPPVRYYQVAPSTSYWLSESMYPGRAVYYGGGACVSGNCR